MEETGIQEEARAGAAPYAEYFPRAPPRSVSSPSGGFSDWLPRLPPLQSELGRVWNEQSDA